MSKLVDIRADFEDAVYNSYFVSHIPGMSSYGIFDFWDGYWTKEMLLAKDINGKYIIEEIAAMWFGYHKAYEKIIGIEKIK